MSAGDFCRLEDLAKRNRMSCAGLVAHLLRTAHKEEGLEPVNDEEANVRMAKRRRAKKDAVDRELAEWFEARDLQEKAFGG